MSEKLNPCPFCGGEARLEKNIVRGYEPAVYYEVRCSKCGQTRLKGRFDSIYRSEKWARREAIKAWNTRPLTWHAWHSGPPTECGWYTLAWKYNDKIFYTAGYRDDNGWVHPFSVDENFIIAWKKIQPYSPRANEVKKNVN